MDSTDRSGITIGGPDTTDEMIQAIIWYYPKADFHYCESEYGHQELLHKFGVEEVKT